MKAAKTILLSFLSLALLAGGCTRSINRAEGRSVPALPATEIPSTAETMLPGVIGADEALEVTWEKPLLDPDWTLDKALSASPFVFFGTCTKNTLSSAYGESDSEFLVEGSLRGDIAQGSTITVKTYMFSAALSAGSSYLIFASPAASVYSNLPLFYYAGEAISKNDTYSGNIKELNDLSYDEVIEKLEAYFEEHPFEGEVEIAGEYCTSDALEDICEFADCALCVTVDGIINNELPDRTIYNCTVTDRFKGSTDEKIEVIGFKDCMESGGRYVLILKSGGSEESPYYTMAARNSVFDATSAEAFAVQAMCK